MRHHMVLFSCTQLYADTCDALVKVSKNKNNNCHKKKFKWKNKAHGNFTLLIFKVWPKLKQANQEHNFSYSSESGG